MGTRLLRNSSNVAAQCRSSAVTSYVGLSGTANPCGALQLYVQQWSDSGFSTPSACLYGGAAVTNTCDFSDTSKTLTGFTTSYSSSSNGIAIGSGLTAGSSAYFTIGVKSATSADNTSQGRQAAFDLDWYIAQ